jgi:hypothetical protein
MPLDATTATRTRHRRPARIRARRDILRRPRRLLHRYHPHAQPRQLGRNLDAFNDILRGGFGTPEGGFILRWANSAISAERLGWPETIRFTEKMLTTCHPSNIPRVQADLAAARRGQGQTLFDIITSIIRKHGPGGIEAEDNVHLTLA